MNAIPSSLPLPAPAAQSLSRFSVSLRLRLLLAALLAILLCGTALLVLNSRVRDAERQVHGRVESSLAVIEATQQAKDALVNLRRQMVMSVTNGPGGDPALAVQAVIDQRQPEVLASSDTLAGFDAGTATKVRDTADALIAVARSAVADLKAGNAPAAASKLRQFPQLGAAAEDALDGLMSQQQQQLRLTLKTADAAQHQAQQMLRVLNGVMLALAALSALMVLNAIFRPLQRLYAALRVVAGGSALKSPPVLGSDEFGQLGKALYELSQLTAQLNTLAYYDNLTGLPNRTQFEHDLATAAREKAPFAVLFADIDHFRTINDGYGHSFGDQVLHCTASRLQRLLNGNVRLYRYSGDLFAACIRADDAIEPGRFRELMASEAERLRNRMTEPLAVESRSLTLCLSLGVALFPDDGQSAEALISAADAAMYQAKQMGRNVVQFARHDSAFRARQRIELADDLRVALKTGAVTPHFQPIVDLGSGAIVCAESLARWKHPTRGFVPPDQFIGIAEDSGQIDALTEQLLRAACLAAVGWTAQRGHPAPRLAFNLSPRQVRQGVVEMVSNVLADTGLPASRLEIEITESAIIERPETAERLLLQLKELGVSVALDDFGTGYSSLSYLLRFPIDKIKVDRSFVAQLNGQRQAGKIVAATISLATNLEITLVAEGVENIGQMVTLYELGCRQQQGWLFSKALAADDFGRWSANAPLKLDAIIRAQAEAANDIKPAA